MALYTQTISRLLHQTLLELMRSPNLRNFYLADTTAMSLRYGHRMSNEIDLYCSDPYNENDLQKLKIYIQNTFGKGEQHQFAPKGKGTSFFLYNLNKDYVKIDLYYAEPAVGQIETNENIRFAATEDLMALKLEQIRRGGTKSDFWDMHFLLQQYPISRIMAVHKQRYPDQHQKNEIRKRLVDFRRADDDFDPQCLLKKNWNLIKLDLIDTAASI